MKLKNVIYLSLLFLAIFSSCNTEFEKQTLTLQPNGTEGEDAVFSKIVPDNNFGDIADIHLYAWTQGGNLNINRVVINFDISSIPSNAIIDSAYLSLYYNETSTYGTEHSGENGFFVQRITSTWDESTVNWTNQPSSTETNQVTVSKSTSSNQDFTKINVLSLVRDMMINKNNCFGFLLKLQDETEYKALYFASSDNTDESLRPRLVVYYLVPVE